MKKLKVFLLTMPIIFLFGCTQNNFDGVDFYPGILEFPVNHDFHNNDGHINESIEVSWNLAVSYDYSTFEEVMLSEVSHIVIAQFVGSRPFGDMYTEFEFIVSDWLLGETTERIFVYSTNAQTHVHGHQRHVSYVPHNLQFEYGVDYLLPIRFSPPVHPTNPVPEDRFFFARQMFINLDNPAASNMYSESLNEHMQSLSLTRTTPRAMIVEFMSDFAEIIEYERRDAWQFINIESDDIHDIISGSPYIFIVDILEFIPLIGSTTWMSIDNFYVNVLEVLKGDPNFWYETRISFAMNTVEAGQQLIVAVQPVGDNNNHFWFDLTSTNNSIFELDRLDEIRAILNQSSHYENDQGDNDDNQGNNNNQGNNQQ